MVKEIQRNTRVVTGKCRFAYVNLFNPRTIGQSDVPKYSMCLLILKTDKETLKMINAAVDEAIIQGTSIWGGDVPKGIKTPLRDGDVEKPDRPEFAGHYFINAASKFKPGIVDKNLNKISDSSVLYSGCYGRASIMFYPYNYLGEKGIGCGIQNLQKTDEGEELLSIPRLEDDFKAIYDILG